MKGLELQIRRALRLPCRFNFFPTTPRVSPRFEVSRHTLLRMNRICELIEAGSFPNATSLASEFNTCTKTIHRDIEALREGFGLRVAYNPQRHGYQLTGDRKPLVQRTIQSD